MAPRSTSTQATSLRAVTPHATNNFAVAKALWVGGAGDVAIVAEDDSAAVTLVGVPAGSYLLIKAKAVRVTGTTATSIVALY